MKMILLISVVTMGVGSLVIGGWAKPEPSTAAPTPASTPTPPTKVTTLKIALYAPPVHPMVVNARVIFPTVEKLTEGRVKVELYDSEKLCPTKETIDALNRGMAHIAPFPLPYFSPNIPWWNVSLVPGLVKDQRGAYDAANNGLLDMYQEAFHSLGLKIKIAKMYSPGLTSLLTKGKRVVVPEDLKGIKVACIGADEVKLMKVLGASPVAMTRTEVYEAMMRGLVDASLGAMSSHSKYKLQEPGDYLLMQTFGSPYITVLISEQALGKLSETDQAIVVEIAREFGFADAYDNATGDKRWLDVITTQLKEVIYPTKEQSQKWQDALSPLLRDFLEKSGEQGKRAVDIIRKYN